MAQPSDEKGVSIFQRRTAFLDLLLTGFLSNLLCSIGSRERLPLYVQDSPLIPANLQTAVQASPGSLGELGQAGKSPGDQGHGWVGLLTQAGG